MRPIPIALAVVVLSILASSASARPTPLGNSFGYQGRLILSGSPVNDSADFQFSLFDADSLGSQIGSIQALNNIDVIEGNFVVTLDFGVNAFNGDERWLEIAVRSPAGSGTFTTLTPRQKVQSTPYALFSLQSALSGTYGSAVNFSNASNTFAGSGAGLTNLNSASLTGTIASSLLAGTYSNALTLSNASNSFTGTHSGNGAALTSLNASNLVSGTVADARLSSNVALLNNIQTFTGAKTFSLAPAFTAAGAPFTVSSTTKVTSLNADLLDGLDSSAFPTLGSNQTWTGVNTFANGSNVFFGSGAGLNSLSAAAITTGNLSASRMPIGGPWTLTSSLHIDAPTLVIDQANDRIGIGTTVPADRLHVFVNSATPGGAIIENFGVSGDAQLLIKTNTGVNREAQVVLDCNSGPTAKILYDGLRLRFFTNDVLAMEIDNSGNVGIGTSGSPFNPFHIITDAVSVDTILVENTNPSGIASFRLTSNNAVSGPRISLDGTSAISAIIRYDDNADGAFRILNGGLERLLIESNGDTGIGDTTPDAKLDVEQSNNTVAIFNRTGNDGTVVAIQQAGTTEGTISVSGTTVSYNAFTGSHYGWIPNDQSIDRFSLVRFTGHNRRLHDDPDSEIIYGIAPTTRANDPACLGAYLGPLDSAQPLGSENPHLVMAVGNGEMWVVQGAAEDNDIQPGDYLISSDTPGCAMKHNPDTYPVGHIVARAAQQLDWSTLTPDTAGVKRAKISVLFGNFVRNSHAHNLVKEKNIQIAELHSRLHSLELAMKNLTDKLDGGPR